VFNIKTLQVLVLWNNPIREIPNGIHTVKLLKKFTVSFNLQLPSILSHLPSGLFSLEVLRYLDRVYNDTSFIPNDIKNLGKLKRLNIEGKQLSALLSGVLNLPLKSLRTENNFIQPLVWNEKIQKLTHLAALCFFRKKQRKNTQTSQKILKNTGCISFDPLSCCFTVCDCCHGPRDGKRLCLTQLYTSIFRFGRLPFYFHSCSSSCHRTT
ncbi:LRC63 protein, partial [Phaetusa simplex]|nr:LRC63 protein [Phaetusa simplex]